MKKKIIKGLACLVILASLAGCNKQQKVNTTITNVLAKDENFVPNGLAGLAVNGVYSWLGIPYATAERFKSPSPVTIINEDTAIAFKNYSYQTANTRYNGLPNEDCLYLNIFAPASLDSTALKPVYVHIHGGNFLEGTSTDDLYDGSYLARKGVIVVTVEYRDNAFGFASVEGKTNFGIEDQILALKFVRDHIKSFGGDPTNVTVGGDGSGNVCVTSLFYNAEAKNLFNKAIINEQTIFNKCDYFTPNESVSDATERIFEDLDLKDATSKQIYEANENGESFKFKNSLYPSFDGTVVKSTNENEIAKQLKPFSEYDVLIGFSRQYVKDFFEKEVYIKSETYDDDIEETFNYGMLTPLYNIAKFAKTAYMFKLDVDNIKIPTQNRFVSIETPFIFNNWNSLDGEQVSAEAYGIGDKLSDIFVNFISGKNVRTPIIEMPKFKTDANEGNYVSITSDGKFQKSEFTQEEKDITTCDYLFEDNYSIEAE